MNNDFVTHFIFLILTSVRKTRNNSSDARGWRDFTCVDHNQQLHQVIVNFAGAALNDINILPSDRFSNFNTRKEGWEIMRWESLTNYNMPSLEKLQRMQHSEKLIKRDTKKGIETRSSHSSWNLLLNLLPSFFLRNWNVTYANTIDSQVFFLVNNIALFVIPQNYDFPKNDLHSVQLWQNSFSCSSRSVYRDKNDNNELEREHTEEKLLDQLTMIAPRNCINGSPNNITAVCMYWSSSLLHDLETPETRVGNLRWMSFFVRWMGFSVLIWTLHKNYKDILTTFPYCWIFW